MTDTTVADAIAHPLDEGVGGVADGEENADSAGYEVAAAVHQYGTYVEEDDLQFQTVDATNEQVDVGPGRAFVEVSGVDVQSDRTGAIDPVYDTTLPSDVVLAVEVPTAETGLGLATDAVNDVWLAVDLDASVTGTAGAVFIRHGSGLAAPAGPSVHLGTVDTTDGSTTRASDLSTPRLADLQFPTLGGTPSFSGHDHSEGGVSAVPNTGLVNNAVTVTAGQGLANGGAVALGGSVTLNVDTADEGTITATGGASPAADVTVATTLSQTAAYDVLLYVDGDPAFNADYAFSYEYSHSWDDVNSVLEIGFTVTWDVDPGAGNDVTLHWAVLNR